MAEIAAILSSGRVGGSQQHSNLYGQWTRIVIPIPTQYQGNSSLQVTFRSEINGSPAGETLSGGDMQPRDSTGAQLSTPHPNAYDRYGIGGVGLTEIVSSGKFKAHTIITHMIMYMECLKSMMDKLIVVEMLFHSRTNLN